MLYETDLATWGTQSSLVALGSLGALTPAANHNRRSTLALKRPAHQVAHVQPVGAGWDHHAVVDCDRGAGKAVPIYTSCLFMIASNDCQS
jgi:hypothetical protein